MNLKKAIQALWDKKVAFRALHCIENNSVVPQSLPLMNPPPNLVLNQQKNR